MATADARAVALAVLLRVERDGSWVDRTLEAELRRADLAPRDRALAVRLAASAVKGRRLLDQAVIDIAGRDLTQADVSTAAVIRLGAAQLLLFDRIPAHAAVSTSVDLAPRRARGFVNALLRRVAVEGRSWVAALPDATPEEAALRRSYPDWIARTWTDAFGLADAKELMERGNEPPEVAFRIVASRPGAEHRVAAEFAELGVALRSDPDAPGARVVEGAVDLAATRAFGEGDLVPMSRSAQRVVPFLGVEPGMRVLDACAAPGGKAGHIAERLGGGEGLVCVERDPGRARRLAEALERQGVSGYELVVADVRELDAAQRDFDRILIDAPCSGLGTVASRPDLRWNRGPADVRRLAALQREMIAALLPRLAPAGRLVLALCTLGTEEDRSADGFAVEERLVLRPDQGAGEGFTAARVRGAG
jgi:16S rRNA (cytosine967-C5)-methyltransferase